MKQKTFYYPRFNIFFIALLGLALLSVGEMGIWAIGVFILTFIPGLRNTKVVLGEKGLTIHEGFFIKNKENVSYAKINNVAYSTGLSIRGIGTVEIFSGNDKPITCYVYGVDELYDQLNDILHSHN